jgi:prolyl 4-hydroxylase
VVNYSLLQIGDHDNALISNTRTSRNTWIHRSSSPIVETLFRRAADALFLDHSLLDNRNAESIQVTLGFNFHGFSVVPCFLDNPCLLHHIQMVHYVKGQKYDAHHDWGTDSEHRSRYITMLIYLTDMAAPSAGGETSFPKGVLEDHRGPVQGSAGGFRVVPVKGNAVVFYNLLEDGNGDDLALHAALPVHEGEKWLANFWVWDPEIKLSA